MQENKIYDSELKSYSLNELYTQLLPILKEIYSDYINIIDEKNLKKKSLEVIKNSVANFNINSGITFEDYFKQNMEDYFYKYISSIMKNNKSKFINDYINNNLNETQVYHDALIEIKKLCSFFEKINYTPKFEMCENIVNNEKINNLLKIIVDNNINFIKLDKIDEVFNEEILIRLIESYCTVNNIVKEYNIDDIDIKTLNDSVKLYIMETEKYPLLTKEEEYDLFIKVSSGDEDAKNKIINSNLRLVVSIAGKFKKNLSNPNEHFLDMIQDGNIALIKAVDKYDVKKGYKFSTYATWWIKQAMRESIIKNSNSFKISRNTYYRKRKIEQTKTILQERLYRDPTNEEISKKINLSTKTIKKIEQSTLSAKSLNDPITLDDDSNELEKFIPSSDESIEDILDKKIVKEGIINIINNSDLSDREKDIIYKIYYENMSMKKIGEEYNLSRQYISQVHDKILLKLRNPKYLNKFNALRGNLNEIQNNQYINNKSINIRKKIIKRINNNILTLLEENIIKKLYGINQKKETFTEISIDLNLSIEEIQKIHLQALDKLGLNKKNNEEENKMAGKQESLYKTLNCTKEEFNIIYSKLDDYDKYIIKIKCGPDLENPTPSREWIESDKYQNYFYRVLKKKLLKELEKIRNNQQIISENSKEFKPNVKLSTKEKIKSEDVEILKKESNNDLNKNEDYLKEINVPDKFLILSTPLETAIAYLRFKLYYTKEEISKILKIEISKIIKVEVEVLTNFRNEIDKLKEKLRKELLVEFGLNDEKDIPRQKNKR